MRHLTIIRPDDWHVHFRDDEVLLHTVPATANHFDRALAMPNLKPALTSLASLQSYYQRILNALPKQSSFKPYMTFYLNSHVTAEDLHRAKQFSFILGAKFYPAGATTHSDEGASSLNALYPLLEIMQENDLVLQVHGEVTYGDIFAREKLFIRDYLIPVMQRFPKLRIVMEHISTKAAVEFVEQASPYLAATITPQHLLYNRNQLLVGGIKPHYYCLPILKSERNQKALQQAAISGNRKFFLGTDSAPHAQSTKEAACGCAGIYSAPFALPLYVEFFDQSNALNKVEGFTSRYGAEFYQLALNQNSIELIEKSQIIPSQLPLGNNKVVPIAAGSLLKWSIHET